MNAIQIFSAEEINLLCIYSTETRAELLDDLRQALSTVFDPELRAIIKTAAAKIEGMTDAEYTEIMPGLIPADEYDGEDK
ncbi:MAG: transposon-transfer assisting family protein [Oscillospiraceae bacterium]|jgi:hypothetical protein|nr:transposon-transfer assisting family protein [Oscillospiraceae bacterium]